MFPVVLMTVGLVAAAPEPSSRFFFGGNFGNTGGNFGNIGGNLCVFFPAFCQSPGTGPSPASTTTTSTPSPPPPPGSPGSPGSQGSGTAGSTADYCALDAGHTMCKYTACRILPCIYSFSLTSHTNLFRFSIYH